MKNIFINRPGNSTIVMVAANFGSNDESNDFKGIAHFIEHMAFKGNPKYKGSEISAKIENLGGVINAFTDNEITAYWAVVGNKDVEKADDIITNLACNPTFPKKEIDKEREVIIQELKMYEDDVSCFAWDLFNAELFHKHSNMSISTIGTRETLQRIGRNEMVATHELKYTNDNLIKIIVGNIDIKESGYRKIVNRDNIVLNLKRKDVVRTRSDISQSNIVIGGFKRFPKGEAICNQYCSKLFRVIMNDMSGRLMEVIREKYNMVYGVSFGIDQVNDTEFQWSVTAGLDKKNIDKARELIVKELTRKITKKEIEVAKVKLMGRMALAMDSNENIARTIAYSEVHNLPYSLMVILTPMVLDSCAKCLNGWVNDMDFENNIMVSVVPEKSEKIK